MGISGLLPLLKEAQVEGHVSHFEGKKLAVDAYVWLHKGAFGCAEDLVKGRETHKYVDYAMYKIRFLRHHGVEPFMVFDGGPLPAKRGTEVSRARSRAENLEKAKALESQGRSKEAKEAYTRCVDVCPEMAYQLIKALRAENVDYVVAPYEADAQLCFLEREGYVDGIITEDSDLLVFGCKLVVFKLDHNGQCVWIQRDRLALVREFPMHGWTDLQFRRMAMLSGCDYLESLPGIGIKTAHRLMRRFNTIEKLLQHLRLEGTPVPSDYLPSFNLAELTFLHQRVYSPSLGRLVPLTPIPEGGLCDEGERWIGEDVEGEIAQGMARGEICPEKRSSMKDWWPNFQGRKVGKSKDLETSSVSGISRASTPLRKYGSEGPMDAFVVRSKLPKKSLPRLARTTSGPSRLSRQVHRNASSRPEQVKSPEIEVKWIKSKFFKKSPTPELDIDRTLKWESNSEQHEKDGREAAENGLDATQLSEPPDAMSRSLSPAISSLKDETSSVKSCVGTLEYLTSPGPILSSPPVSSPLGREVSCEKTWNAEYQKQGVAETIKKTNLSASTCRSPSDRFDVEIESSMTVSRILVPAPTNLTTLSSSSQIISSTFDSQSHLIHEGVRTKLMSKVKEFSSDTPQEEELTTPSYQTATQNRKRSMPVKKSRRGSMKSGDEYEDDENEERRREKARSMANSWKMKYAFRVRTEGQSSSPTSDAVENETSRSGLTKAHLCASSRNISAPRALKTRPPNLPQSTSGIYPVKELTSKQALSTLQNAKTVTSNEQEISEDPSRAKWTSDEDENCHDDIGTFDSSPLLLAAAPSSVTSRWTLNASLNENKDTEVELSIGKTLGKLEKYRFGVRR
ncbi:uncharacterized protein L203_104168 [Cryptococcus depauperatus CBS 7841]|uniref:Uncharacterized protein n=1 Tax=Cryptococcus depauperatus CBS 7841 TaxID=1295531 RepID=A0A1E3HJT2_9TREE|nr:hypothetical protein L203_06473 [Cryptococcus depauperatus CBS 7841]